MRCYYHLCFCQEAPLSLKDQDNERGNKKKEMNDIQKRIQWWEWKKNWKKWKIVTRCEKHKTHYLVKNIVRTQFPNKVFFQQILQKPNWFFQCFPEFLELFQKNPNRNLQFSPIKKKFVKIIWVSNWKRMQSRARV